MNKQEFDIMNALFEKPYENQRELAEQTGHSLGIVNKCMKKLSEEAYIDREGKPTEKAVKLYQRKVPKNAIILAAGFGMRMVPINTETTKGLLEVNGEPLIERLIKQLHEAGVTNIKVVTGFMKEQYEYLIDEYQVKLVVNPVYASKNNLHSVKLVANELSDTYIVPCDIWSAKNPFSKYEPYSWYMVSNKMDKSSNVRVNRKQELVTVSGETLGNTMIGIAYLTNEDAVIVKDNISKLCQDARHDNDFWETALYKGDKMLITAKEVEETDVVEINTYEQLRELDSKSNQLKTDAISIIAKALNAEESEIVDIQVLKKGMTNRSFLFRCRDKKYIMRIPGEGTEQLINRKEEAAVYHQIMDDKICDNIVYLNPENGFKLTEYLEGARTCDPLDLLDLKKCMAVLRRFHEKEFIVEHEFNIFKQIEFYESLWDGKPSVFKDYSKTKERIFSLKSYIDKHADKKVLTHIDAVPDNFLIVGDEIRLIDWEYAGMQDPHVDVAMFCIYAMYNHDQVEQLIDCYFTEGCSKETRIKIYCYIAACGLLWSNWCEYKRNLGVEFGEYSLRQYRYAKDYYKLVQEKLEEMESCIK